MFNFFITKSMFKYKILVVLLMQAACLTQTFATELIETTHIEKTLEISKKNTLVLSDITNTLYKPCNTMSDKRWRSYLSNRVSEVIQDSVRASKIANYLENIIVHQVDKKLVHQNMPSVIKELQANKIPFIAISLKNWSAPYDPNFGITTFKHLKKLDINLERSVPLLGKMQNGANSNYENIQDVNKTDEYTFAKGIIFTNKAPLDKALDAFLDRLEKKPQHIVILENSYEHKEKLEAVIKAHGIALTFIRHKSSENQEHSFDPTLGTIEFLQFMKNSKIILDEEAIKIKSYNSSVNYETLLNDFIKEYTQVDSK